MPEEREEKPAEKQEMPIRKPKNMKEKRSAPPPILDELFRLVMKLAVIVLAVLALFSFVFGIHRSTEAAMHPMVKDGDLVVYYRLDKSYTASDVIVLEYNGQLQTRRVIATAGDTVNVTENGLMVNGAYVAEPDIYEKTYPITEEIAFPLTVGEDEVFVLGDSREHAGDSRMYGCVKVRDTYGKVMMILRRRGI
jgi:signal peptidase I